MIRVLLADDDFLVKDILQNMIPWKELNMKVIGFAENGQETLDICLEQEPDILITDIRMPILNGLEVALSLRERNLKTKVILISGIQDFDYARTALDVQASGYLLKPIRMNEIIATLKKVQESIDLELNRTEFLHKMQNRLKENLPFARASFLRSLLHGTYDKNDNLSEKLEYFALPFRPSESVVAVIGSIDNYDSLIQNRRENEIQMLNFTVRDIMEKSICNYHAGAFVDTKENELVLIFNQSYCNINKMTNILEGITDLLRQFGDLTISFGIGMPTSDICTVSSSFHEARKALEHKFYVGNQSIIQVDDIIVPGNLISEDINLHLQSLGKDIMKQIKLGDQESLIRFLNEFYHLIAQTQSLSREYICGQFFELIIHAYREFCETENDQPDVSKCYSAASEIILRAENISEIRRHTQDFLLYLAKHFSQKYSNRHLILVEQIKNYIAQHRIENITINDIAQSVYMSPNYISAVFKKECGQTIHDYLLEAKMKEAQKLLQETKMKVLEISEYLGYETPHYFSYSFKRYTGKTPNQYRKELTLEPPDQSL